MPTKTILRRAHRWSTRGKTWDLSEAPLLLGVVNVTPDSFSEKGAHFESEAAIERGRRLVEEGAKIIDVGGESTRPGAEPVEAREEMRRVIPVIEGLAAQGIAVSVDTTKAEVARAGLEAGALVINDISAGRFDNEMIPLAAETGAGFIAMHMRGEPRTMQDAPEYQDAPKEIAEFLEGRLDALVEAGIAREAIALDPGIGFGKRLEHNLQVLAHLNRVIDLGAPVVIGCSRKSFIGAISGAAVDRRVPGTLAAHLWAWSQGAQILRVHDVAEAKQALDVWRAIHAGGRPAPGE
jgi:dihydropteroate synthase